jgi:hypothetical protein
MFVSSVQELFSFRSQTLDPSDRQCRDRWLDPRFERDATAGLLPSERCDAKRCMPAEFAKDIALLRTPADEPDVWHGVGELARSGAPVTEAAGDDGIEHRQSSKIPRFAKFPAEPGCVLSCAAPQRDAIGKVFGKS